VPGLAYLTADVADAADRRRLLAWVEAEHPDTNVLVNNAGLQRRVRLADGADAVDTGEIATNLEAPIHLTALFLPRLLGQAARGRPAAVVNVTSGLGYVPLAATPIYGPRRSGSRRSPRRSGTSSAAGAWRWWTSRRRPSTRRSCAAPSAPAGRAGRRP
jgi:uncharacterized oxidoreductase